MNRGAVATPLGELQDYIGNVLLSSTAIIAMLDEKKWMARERKLFGDEVVVAEIHDMLAIGVWRNYFQYSWAYDERRTARVGLVVTHVDRTFAYELVRALTNLVIERENERRAELAKELATQTQAVLDSARERVAEARRLQQQADAAVAAAVARGDTTQAAIEDMHAAEAAAAAHRAEDAFFAVEQTTTNEALEASVTSAGLALEIQVVFDKKPPKHERSMVMLVGVLFASLCIFLPLAGVVIGAFDVRVHDNDDVARIELPILGHIPSFPGDTVGALRDRGVRLRRVTSWVPWR
jgi:capsular polysaccharide biosynthesis protein